MNALSHPRPDYAEEFGKAAGLLECLAKALRDDVLPADVREKYVGYLLARVDVSLADWGRGDSTVSGDVG